MEDGSRNVRGVADPLDAEERLANLINDRISPRLVPEIEILPYRQTQVLALQVYPNQVREWPAAGVYIRVGSTNRLADAELIEELRRFSRGEDVDDRLEIENPALLPFGLTVEDMPHGVSKLLNRR